MGTDSLPHSAATYLLFSAKRMPENGHQKKKIPLWWQTILWTMWIEECIPALLIQSICLCSIQNEPDSFPPTFDFCKK